MNKFSFDNFLLHDQAEFKSNQMCHKVCQWIKKHGKDPSHASIDPIEKRLGNWLNRQRQSKAGKGKCKIYESNLVIVKEEYDLPDLFEQTDYEQESNEKCHECCKWIKKHGKDPSHTSKDPIEKRLGNWLSVQRQAKAGKGTSKFYESNLVIAKKYDLPDLFEQTDLEQESNEKCHKVCQLIKKHGKTPSQHSKDPIEKNLGKWLSTQRQGKAGKGKSKFYESNLVIAKKYGLPDLFEQTDLEQESNEKCHECCKWIKKHGKTPSQTFKDPIEKRLVAWLFNQRQAKAGKGTSKFYESNLVIAKKYVLPDLFEQIDLEQESNEKCHECCKWIKKHGKNPSKRSKDPIEKNLGLWLSTQRQAKAGKGKSKFYLSNQAIVESDKLPNLFTRK
jgi:hypothetical protein